MIDTDISNIQLKTILYSFDNQTKLIYDKGHFFATGSSAKLTGIYSDNPAFIQEKVINFIEEHKGLLQIETLTEMEIKSTNRLKKITSLKVKFLNCIHSFFCFVTRTPFNNNALDNEIFLRKFKQTIQEAIAFLSITHKQEKIDSPFQIAINSPPTTPVKAFNLSATTSPLKPFSLDATTSPMKPLNPDSSIYTFVSPQKINPSKSSIFPFLHLNTSPFKSIVSQPVKPPTHPHPLNLPPVNPSSFMSPLRTSFNPPHNLPTIPPKLFLPPSPKSLGPVIHPTPTATPIPTPIPTITPGAIGLNLPPPPPMGKKPTYQKNKTLLFKDEPEPLTNQFPLKCPPELKKEEAATQIKEITVYIQKLKEILTPLEKTIERKEKLEKDLQELESILIELPENLKRLKINLTLMEEAEKEKRNLSFYYKEGENYHEICYICSAEYAIIQARSNEIQLKNNKHKIEQLTLSSETLKTKNQPLTESEEAELKGYQEQIEQLAKAPLELDHLNIANVLGTIRDQIQNLDTEYTQKKELSIAYQKELNEILQLKNQDIPFSDFKSLINTKKNLCKEWEKAKEGREYKSRLTTSKKASRANLPKIPRSNKLSSELTNQLQTEFSAALGFLKATNRQKEIALKGFKLNNKKLLYSDLYSEVPNRDY